MVLLHLLLPLDGLPPHRLPHPPTPPDKSPRPPHGPLYEDRPRTPPNAQQHHPGVSLLWGWVVPRGPWGSVLEAGWTGRGDGREDAHGRCGDGLAAGYLSQVDPVRRYEGSGRFG